jgi:hypothetical protein
MQNTITALALAVVSVSLITGLFGLIYDIKSSNGRNIILKDISIVCLSLTLVMVYTADLMNK